MRVLMEGLGHAAAMMREAALKTLLRPGASEIELAQATEEMARRALPMMAPMMDDLLRLELRHSVETEAVNAAERAAGKLPVGAKSPCVSPTLPVSPGSVRRFRPRTWNASRADSPNSHTMWRLLP